jgi:hypothetical protein
MIEAFTSIHTRVRPTDKQTPESGKLSHTACSARTRMKQPVALVSRQSHREVQRLSVERTALQRTTLCRQSDESILEK